MIQRIPQMLTSSLNSVIIKIRNIALIPCYYLIYFRILVIAPLMSFFIYSPQSTIMLCFQLSYQPSLLWTSFSWLPLSFMSRHTFEEHWQVVLYNCSQFRYVWCYLIIEWVMHFGKNATELPNSKTSQRHYKLKKFRPIFLINTDTKILTKYYQQVQQYM